MFYERAESSMGSEMGNVIEFSSKEKPVEHAVEHILKEAGAHESPVLLSESELSKAEVELDKLQEQKKQILVAVNKGIKVMGFGNSKTREANNNMDVKNLPEIGKQIHKLERDIAFTKASASMGGQEYDKAA
ncbi:MAG TPA: hypothetical protein VHQ41_01990 [Patescibacteria group bacterium]|jgi:TRAP-type uncharacterized transport system substrate-binding protein|nr:hypothetical protein [Patescibacteria group bacterium]